jgi:hypothetical protein
MAIVPFELRCALPRRSTLGPHLRTWGPTAVLTCASWVLALAAPFVAGRLALAITLPMLAVAWIGRGFLVGVVDGLRGGAYEIDLRVEVYGLGVRVGGARRWLALDGIRAVEQLRPGLWTVRHRDGVLHIPAARLDAEQLEYLRAAARRHRC